MDATQAIKRPAAKDKKIPGYLIYETIDGKPFYYKGYRDVINKTKTLEEIMAASGIQSQIIHYLNIILYTIIGVAKYRFYSNETGVHIDHWKNLASDLAIYDKTSLTAG
jgi:hypothetical protein